MHRISKLLLLMTLVAALAVGCVKSTSMQAEPTAPYTTPLQVGSQTIFVEVADNDKSRQRGLSGRERLSDSQGMLFDFHDSGVSLPSFWMKEMTFSLDFIWIKDGLIIGITHEAPLENHVYNEDYTIYRAPGPVDSVLEVNAKWAQDHRVKVGDTVKF